MTLIVMPRPKSCGCCRKTFEYVPEYARFDDSLEVWYWECTCMNTLTYVPDQDRTFRLARQLAIKYQARHLNKDLAPDF